MGIVRFLTLLEQGGLKGMATHTHTVLKLISQLLAFFKNIMQPMSVEEVLTLLTRIGLQAKKQKHPGFYCMSVDMLATKA